MDVEIGTRVQVLVGAERLLACELRWKRGPALLLVKCSQDIPPEPN